MHLLMFVLHSTKLHRLYKNGMRLELSTENITGVNVIVSAFLFVLISFQL